MKKKIKVSLDDLANDPSFFLHGIDFKNQLAQFHRIDAGLPNIHCSQVTGSRPMLVPVEYLLEQVDALPELLLTPVHFIWMTDFCGSTLFAKALNVVPKLYLYNETQLFCDIANARRLIDDGQLQMGIEQWRNVLRAALFYQRKTFVDSDVAIVKEWPLSNYILHEILDMSDAFRGIFLYASLDEYLVSCLKDERRRKLARERVTNTFIEMKSIDALKAIDRKCLTDAQAAALHWLYLMYWHHDNGYQDHTKLRTLFNKDFFADPIGALRQSVDHLGLVLRAKEAEKIVASDIFNKHSKNSSRTFSMKEHKASLAANRIQFDREVTAGLKWAEAIKSRFPLPDHPGTSLSNTTD